MSSLLAIAAEAVAGYEPATVTRIERALDLAAELHRGQVRASADLYLAHPR